MSENTSTNADGTLAFLKTRERFLPVPTPLILERVLQDPRFSDEERERFKMFVSMTQARFHFEFLGQIERLKTLYDPFNPDRDTLPLRELSAEEREVQFAELVESFRKLLIGGNYVELTRDQLLACLEMQCFGGLAVRVDLDQYKDIHVFYRGLKVEDERRRFWFLPGCGKKRKVRTFKRVAILVRTVDKGEETVLVKLFKDVVLENVKMVTPQVRIQMRVLDKIKVSSTVVGGLATPIVKLAMAAAFSTWLFVIVLGGCIGAFVRGVFSFMSSKTKYMQTLSSSLYYQNMANNVSVLTRLVDAAEAEEAKEMLLAYFLLYIERNRDYTMEELDQRVEQWLHGQFDEWIDFEVDDAVRKLLEKDLMVERVVEPAPAMAPVAPEETEPQSGGPHEGPSQNAQDAQPRRILKVYDLPSTLRRLDEWWDNFFVANNEGDPSNDRIADGDWPPFPEQAASPPESTAPRYT